MKTNILLFSYLKEKAQRPLIEVEINNPLKPEELFLLIEDELPALKGLLINSKVAMNGDYLNDDEQILPGEEIAIIPPVSGG